MPNLFPVGYDEYTVTAGDAASSRPIGFKPGTYFDTKKGDYERDGLNKTRTATGLEAYERWCHNCLSIEKGELDYYSNVGVSTNTIFQATSDRDLLEGLLKTNIEDALLADPYGRTKTVSDFEFDWSAPDGVEVSFTVTAINEATLDMIIVLKG